MALIYRHNGIAAVFAQASAQTTWTSRRLRSATSQSQRSQVHHHMLATVVTYMLAAAVCSTPARCLCEALPPFTTPRWQQKQWRQRRRRLIQPQLIQPQPPRNFCTCHFPMASGPVRCAVFHQCGRPGKLQHLICMPDTTGWGRQHATASLSVVLVVQAATRCRWRRMK